MTIPNLLDEHIQRHRDFLAKLTPENRKDLPLAGPEIAHGLEMLEFQREKCDVLARDLPLLARGFDNAAADPDLHPMSRAMAVAMARMAEACEKMMFAHQQPSEQTKDFAQICSTFGLMGKMCESCASLIAPTN
jgi:hypothetical protein